MFGLEVGRGVCVLDARILADLCAPAPASEVLVVVRTWDSEARNLGSVGGEMVQNVILVFFRRRLSQRPAVEELESRNILKRK